MRGGVYEDNRGPFEYVRLYRHMQLAILPFYGIISQKGLIMNAMPIPLKQPAPKKEPVKNKIYRTLCEWITYGTLCPGERLNDQEISEYFEVSRTPVREALQMLAAQKLVEIYPNKGTVVTAIETDRMDKWYVPLAHLHGLAAELACGPITEQQIDELEALDLRISSLIQQGDIVNTLQVDLLLHNRVLEIAGNEFICEFSETLMLHIQRMEYAQLRSAGLSKSSFASHRELIEAFRRHDAEAASRTMMRNWLISLEHANTLAPPVQP